MKKYIIGCLLAVCMCALVGCGDSNDMDGALNQTLEYKDDAKEAVGEYNENIQELEDTADQVEEEE